jgi:predicted amidohydrolase
MSRLKIGMFEVKIRRKESSSSRIQSVISALEQVPYKSLDLLILPELWIAGAFDFESNLKLDQGKIKKALYEVAKIAKHKQIFIHSGTHPLVGANKKLTNTAIVFNNQGETICTYKKIHLFGFENGEKSIFVQGDEMGYFEIKKSKVGVSTCYDLRFPELYIKQIINGVKIILISASWPKARIYQWQQLLIARAIESQSFVIGCNASGSSAGISLGSNSMVIDPLGKNLELRNINGILTCTFNINAIEKYRSNFPVLQDRCKL